MKGRPRAVADTTAYAVLVRCFRRRGYAPTVDEYRAALGVGSTRTALRYLGRLERAGQITRWPGARGIALKQEDQMLPTQEAFVEAQKLHRGTLANLTAVECPDKDCYFCEPLAVALHEYAAEYRDLWAQRSDDAGHAESRLAKVRKMAIKPRQVGLLIMMGCLLCDCVWRGDEAENHVHDCPAVNAR